MLQQVLPLGQIVGVHGVKGAVKVKLETDEPTLLWKSDKIFFDEQMTKPVKVLSGFLHKQMAIIQIDGYSNPEEAYLLKGSWLFAPRTAFSLKQGQYFLADLIGCSVIDADSKEVYGKLEYISNFGASPIYEIRTSEGKLLMAPAIKEVVIRLAPEENLIEIRPLEGLFDA